MPPLLVWSGALAVVAAAGAQEPLAARVALALARARPALLHHLARADAGELALCSLAALHGGVPRDEPAFAAVRRQSTGWDVPNWRTPTACRCG